jgi:hypothetical protein
MTFGVASKKVTLEDEENSFSLRGLSSKCVKRHLNIFRVSGEIEIQQTLTSRDKKLTWGQKHVVPTTRQSFPKSYPERLSSDHN